MIAKSLEGFFFFGTAVRYLQNASVGQRVHDSPEALYILSNLQAFFRFIDDIGLQVTNRAASDLRTLMQELERTAKDAALTPEQAKRLSEGMTDVRKTLVAEIKGFEAYLVTPKRLDVNRLLKYPEQLLAPQVFNSLPALARFDIAEAGKCLAFERPTAAAFHLLRATECALRALCEKHVKRNRPQLLWGPMVARLRGVDRYAATSLSLTTSTTSGCPFGTRPIIRTRFTISRRSKIYGADALMLSIASRNICSEVAA